MLLFHNGHTKYLQVPLYCILSEAQADIFIKTLLVKTGMLPNQLIISLTPQEYMSRWKTISLDPPLVGFEPQLQSIALQNDLQK